MRITMEWMAPAIVLAWCLNAAPAAAMDDHASHANEGARKAMNEIERRIAEIEHSIELEIEEGDDDEIMEFAPDLDELIAGLEGLEAKVDQIRLQVVEVQIEEIEHMIELEIEEGDQEEADEKMPELNALKSLRDSLEHKLDAATAGPSAEALLSVCKEIDRVQHIIDLEVEEGDDEEAEEHRPRLAELTAKKSALVKALMSQLGVADLNAVKKAIADVEHIIKLEEEEGDHEEAEEQMPRLHKLQALETALMQS